MVLVYNKTRFQELKHRAARPPGQDFAKAAADVRKKDPDDLPRDLRTGGVRQLRRAGAAGRRRPGGRSRTQTWTVGIDDQASHAVADYWQGLIDKDLVKAEPLLTPEWNNQLNEGKILSWPSAAVGAGRAVRRRGEAGGRLGHGAAAPVEGGRRPGGLPGRVRV